MASDCLCSSMFATLCRFCCKSQIFKKLCENPFFLLKHIFRLLLSLKIELLDFFVENKQLSIKKHTIVNVLFFQVARDNLSLEKIQYPRSILIFQSAMFGKCSLDAVSMLFRCCFNAPPPSFSLDLLICSSRQ